MSRLLEGRMYGCMMLLKYEATMIRVINSNTEIPSNSESDVAGSNDRRGILS